MSDGLLVEAMLFEHFSKSLVVELCEASSAPSIDLSLVYVDATWLNILRTRRIECLLQIQIEEGNTVDGQCKLTSSGFEAKGELPRHFVPYERSQLAREIVNSLALYKHLFLTKRQLCFLCLEVVLSDNHIAFAIVNQVKLGLPDQFQKAVKSWTKN